MRIERTRYLKRLIGRRENGLVKVVTGMRRCGKSYLLRNLFVDYLLQDGVKTDHIIYVNLDDFESKPLRNPEVLYSHIKKCHL